MGCAKQTNTDPDQLLSLEEIVFLQLKGLVQQGPWVNSKYLEFFSFADFLSTDSDLLIKLYPEHFSFFYFFMLLATSAICMF